MLLILCCKISKVGAYNFVFLLNLELLREKITMSSMKTFANFIRPELGHVKESKDMVRAINTIHLSINRCYLIFTQVRVRSYVRGRVQLLARTLLWLR